MKLAIIALDEGSMTAGTVANIIEVTADTAMASPCRSASSPGTAQHLRLDRRPLGGRVIFPAQPHSG